MTTDHPSSYPAPLRLALAPDWRVETIAPGVDVERSGLYEWRIEGAGSYVGQYRRISRPRRQYPRNVVRLLNDLPYRRGRPDGFRRIHRELAAALMEGRRIELVILENADKPGINERERMLIAERGCLNDPPFGRRSGGADPGTTGTA